MVSCWQSASVEEGLGLLIDDKDVDGKLMEALQFLEGESCDSTSLGGTATSCDACEAIHCASGGDAAGVPSSHQGGNWDLGQRV